MVITTTARQVFSHRLTVAAWACGRLLSCRHRRSSTCCLTNTASSVRRSALPYLWWKIMEVRLIYSCFCVILIRSWTGYWMLAAFWQNGDECGTTNFRCCCAWCRARTKAWLSSSSWRVEARKVTRLAPRLPNSCISARPSVAPSFGFILKKRNVKCRIFEIGPFHPSSIYLFVILRLGDRFIDKTLYIALKR